MKLETVKIKTEYGYKTINKSDLGKDDVIYSDDVKETPKRKGKK